MIRVLASAVLIVLLGTSTAGAQKPSPARPQPDAVAQAQRKNADELFMQGKIEEAKTIYLRLAGAFREDFEFNKRLGDCFYVSPKREMDKAALYYGRAHAINSNNAEVEKLWANSLAWSKQYSAAIPVLEAIVAREPGNRDALLQLARAHNYGGHEQSARADYESYLKQWPQDHAVRIEFAAFLSWNKHPDEALENYRAVLKSDPKNVNAALGEAQVLAWQGQLEQALQSYDAVLARHPRSFVALRGKAFTLLWLQRYDEAEKVFIQANKVRAPDAETQEAMRRIARWKAEEPERRRQAEIDVYRRPAEAALARNDLPQAIEQFRKALTLAPGDEQLRFRLGLALLWNQQWPEAAEIFQKLHAERPSNLPALLELAHAQSAAKQLAEAAQTLRTYLEHSDELAVRVNMARVLSWSSRFDESRAEYQAVLDKQPNNFDAALGLAQIASWQGRSQEALERYDGLLRQRPENREGLLGKAQVLFWTGHTQEAMALLQELRARLPQDREVANIWQSVQDAEQQRADQQKAAANRAENLDQSIRSLQAALQSDPNNASTLERLGDAYAQKNDFKQSVSFYERALAQKPGDETLTLTTARIASWGRDYPRSIELYRALISAKPDNRNYQLELARILSWSGHVEDSLKQYRALLERYPSDAEIRMGLAQVLSWNKQLDESLAEYARVLKDDPGNREAKLQQARVYSWKGDVSTALRLYDELLILAPNDRDARLGKAQVLNWSGQPREAKGIIAEIQKNEPKNPDVALANASVQASLGRRDLALRQLDELDKLQPGNRDLEALRRSIRQEMRPTLIIGVTPSVDSGDARIYATTATFYFSPSPQVRSYVATNFLPTSVPVSNQETGREFLFGSYARAKDWLQLRGEIGGNVASAGNPSPIGGGGVTVFATDKMQFDFDVSRRFINYIPRPIQLDISRIQLRGAWNWRPRRGTTFHVDYFHERYSDTNRNNGANFSVMQTLVRKEHVDFEAGYLYAISGFTKTINSGFFAPTSFERHAALGNVRVKFNRLTGISFWGSLGREQVFDGPFRLDGTARTSWDYQVSPQMKMSLGYGYFAVSSVGSSGAYITHAGYATLQYVF